MASPRVPSDGRSNAADSVRVYARFRPLSSTELEKDVRSCADYDSDQVVSISNPDEGTKHRFTFQCVYQPDTTQQAIFAAVGVSVVEDVLKGYNATIFAYGQTGSGKTYTMLGAPNSVGRSSAATPLRQSFKASSFSSWEDSGFDLHGPSSGLVPRAVHELFDRIKRAPVTTKFTVRISYVEIYMERIRDLFDPSKSNLPLREDIANRRFYVDGCVTYDATSAAEVLECIDQGTRNRATSATKANEMSSRSHSIVALEVTSIDESNEVVLVGRLNLVDLAGSEKVSKTLAAGLQLEEAKLINKSLTTLSLVISNLIDGKSGHVPYRDSKLTRLLQDSLGGNARTSLIVCCSPSLWNIQETISTLRFGSLVTRVENHAIINQEQTPGELKAIIMKLEEEVRQLRARPAGSGNMAAEELKNIEALREDAQQLVLLQRQYDRQNSVLVALRETANDATLREQLASRRADSAELQLQLLVEENSLWEEEYRRCAQELHRTTQSLSLEVKDGLVLRSAVVQAHDALEAAREELLTIQEKMTELRVSAPAPLIVQRDETSSSAAAHQPEVVSSQPQEEKGAATLSTREKDAKSTQSACVCVTCAATQTLENPPEHPSEAAAPTTPASAAASAPFAADQISDDLNSTVSWARYDAACRRANVAEQQLRALEEQWRELVNEATASKLELEFSLKRLQIRNERLENLKAALRKEKEEVSRMTQLREAERQAMDQRLRAAQQEALGWKLEVERLGGIVTQIKQARNALPNFVGDPASDPCFPCASPGTPVRALGGYFARQLRGGTPSSVKPSPSEAGTQATPDLARSSQEVTAAAQLAFSPHVLP